MILRLSRVSMLCLGSFCSTLDRQEPRSLGLCGGLFRVSRV